MAKGNIAGDTSSDTKEAEENIKILRSKVASLASEYKKAGMTQSEAMKTAWAEVKKSSKEGSEEVAKNIKDMSEGVDIANKAFLGVASTIIKSSDEMTALVDKFKEMGANIMGSSLERVGTLFYDNLSEPAKETIADVIEWFDKLDERISNGELDDALSYIASGLAAVGTALLVFNAVVIVKDFIAVMKGAEAATTLVAKSQAILTAVMNMSPIGLIAIAIAALVAGFIVLWNTNEGFRIAVIDCWNAIKEAGVVVWEWLVKFFTEDIPNAWNMMVEFFVGIPQWFSDLWASVTETFRIWGENTSKFFTETVPIWIENLVAWFGELPYKIGEKLGQLLSIVIECWLNIWTYLFTNVPIWLDSIVSFFSELPGKIGIWLYETYNNVVNWGLNMFSKAVEIGTNFITNIISWFSQLPSRIGIWLSETISKVAEFAINLALKASEAGANMVNNIIGVVTGLPSKMVGIGKSIVEGIVSGIMNSAGWLRDKLNGFIDGVIEGFKSGFKINSPSKVMRDKIGVSIPEGIAVGVDKGMPDLDKNIKDNINEMTSRMQATVDFETYRISAGVVNASNYKVRGDGNDSNTIDEGIKDGDIFILKNYMDSDEISEFTYKKVNGKLALSGKAVR